ncbi:MAG: hypothetical protein M3333_02800 [Actinomycetota bacterium]|nr:hypothetical protein [Actinomycetota bacterium]
MSGRDRTSEGRDLFRWTLGAGLASIALLGLLILVGLVAVAAQPPEWLQFGLGVLLAVGSATFAGLVAHALRPEGPAKESSVYSARDQSADDRERRRRTA